MEDFEKSYIIRKAIRRADNKLWEMNNLSGIDLDESIKKIINNFRDDIEALPESIRK